VDREMREEQCGRLVLILPNPVFDGLRVSKRRDQKIIYKKGRSERRMNEEETVVCSQPRLLELAVKRRREQILDGWIE
jgi:hypothetical protein